MNRIRAALLGLIIFLGASGFAVAQYYGGPLLLRLTISSGGPIGTPVNLGTTQNSSSNQLILTLANASPAGNLIVVCVRPQGGQTVTNVTDSNLSTYAQAVGKTQGTYDEEMWYLPNAGALTTSQTITVNLSGTPTNNYLSGVSVSGIQVSPLDKTQSGSVTTGTSDSISTATLSQANEFVVGCATNNNATTNYTESGSFSQVNFNSTFGASTGSVGLDQEKVASTTAVTYNPVWSQNTSALINLVATFKGF